MIAAVGYAMLLGGAVGYERELTGRPAGFRTHMLVAGAAALLVGLGDLLAEQFSVQNYGELVRVDPIRLIEAVVTAVAFLGAGMIIRRGGRDAVIGLTTSAGLLIVAAIGVAVGLRQYVLAAGAAVLTLIVLRLLRAVESKNGD